MIRRRLTFALLPLALSAQLGTAARPDARPATTQPGACAGRAGACRGAAREPRRSARDARPADGGAAAVSAVAGGGAAPGPVAAHQRAVHRDLPRAGGLRRAAPGSRAQPGLLLRQRARAVVGRLRPPRRGGPGLAQRDRGRPDLLRLRVRHRHHHLAGQDAGGPPPLAAPVEGPDRGPHQADGPLHQQRRPAWRTSNRRPARGSSSRPPSRSTPRRTPRNIGAPFGRIFWSVQAGAVLLLSGLRACSLSASASSGKKSASRCRRWASSSSPSAWAS